MGKNVLVEKENIEDPRLCSPLIFCCDFGFFRQHIKSSAPPAPKYITPFLINSVIAASSDFRNSLQIFDMRMCEDILIYITLKNASAGKF